MTILGSKASGTNATSRDLQNSLGGLPGMNRTRTLESQMARQMQLEQMEIAQQMATRQEIVRQSQEARKRRENDHVSGFTSMNTKNTGTANTFYTMVSDYLNSVFNGR
jgi:hypothetical protein